MRYNRTNILNALAESFNMYKQHGARSTQKLVPIHNYIADVLRDIWGDQFCVHCMGSGDSEIKVQGKYYPKDIDITITDKNNKPLFCVGIKFVTSNYKQNANNYFESMMGETANIQAQNSLPYAHIIFLRYKTPYYRKNNSDTPSKIETITKQDISKYVNLMFDNAQAHRPHVLGLMLIDIDEKSYAVDTTTVEDHFEEELSKILNSKLSISNFFTEVENYSTYLKSKQ